MLWWGDWGEEGLSLQMQETFSGLRVAGNENFDFDGFCLQGAPSARWDV
jgi:hypothetical protein